MPVNSCLPLVSISKKCQLITGPRIVTEVPVTTVSRGIRPNQPEAYSQPLVVRCRFLGKRTGQMVYPSTMAFWVVIRWFWTF